MANRISTAVMPTQTKASPSPTGDAQPCQLKVGSAYRHSSSRVSGVRSVIFTSLLHRLYERIEVRPEPEHPLLRLDDHRHLQRQDQVADAELQPVLRMLLRSGHAADLDHRLRPLVPQMEELR